MKKKILIEGMHGASCASNIERSLKKVRGVESVSVSMMTHKAIVECDENVKDEELQNAVKKAGYQVKEIESF